ncbi:MAG: pyridoxamine 5'-phosphate oxidase family protein [Flavobacteriales bacterium]|nr:pyridoxamine 5'-phosphate oxidase family protein [Flavobacteriales bacterium]
MEKLKYTSDIAFTPVVKAIQESHHSRSNYARMEESGGWQKAITPQLENFLADIDSFYLSTSNVDGQPYTQHRGGPKGFLKVLDTHTLAFADFGGNRQYITAGNLSENNKAFIFLMDYTTQTRIKVWGTAKIDDQDQQLMRKLSDESYKARIERSIIFTVEAWDINCRQHIQKRFTEEDVALITTPLNDKIKVLEELLKKN